MSLAGALAAALLCLAIPVATAQLSGDAARSAHVLHWSSSADWEYYRSNSTSQDTDASFDALRQRYAVDLSGSIWDPRFSRFSVGIDLYRSDREANGVKHGSEAVGYRTALTLFAGRPFPLRLHARRTATEVGAAGLADNDRENRSWGADWNIALGGRQKLRLLYEESGYDLISPIALRERRQTRLVDYGLNSDTSELTVRYSHQDDEEQVNGTEFIRDDATVTHRTRFRNQATLLVSAHHTASDARFASGDTDDLTVSRLFGALDLPGKGRARWNLGYDFNDNDGRFAASTSHNLRLRTRIRLARHWESTAGLSGGTLVSRSTEVERREQSAGARLGLRYSRVFAATHLDASASGGFTQTHFNVEPDRAVLSYGVAVGVQVPVGGHNEIFARASQHGEENDTSGVGYTFDETRGSLGWEGRLGVSTSARLMGYIQDTSRDTFDFGLQKSRELGTDLSFSGRGGGVSVTLATSDGITDFTPDPAGGSIFIPETDLVTRVDSATIGARWRLPYRLGLRLQARLEDRDFSTVGKERIVSYSPQLEWAYRVWTFGLRFSHYERTNGTVFSDDTWVIKVSRRIY